MSATSHYFSHDSVQTALEPHWIEAQALGHTLRLATGAGVFAKRGLDEGSRILLESAELTRAQRISDLGCGWGAVGCFLATQFPAAQICMCDINRRAVQLAALNARTNGLSNTHIWCGDGLSGARDNSFDAVLLNPPVRAGNEVIQKLFNDAHRCLQPHGCLWIVLRTAQGAKSWAKRLEQQWGNCDTVAIEKGYRVLKCES